MAQLNVQLAAAGDHGPLWEGLTEGIRKAMQERGIDKQGSDAFDASCDLIMEEAAQSIGGYVDWLGSDWPDYRIIVLR